jgi:hypothetical protein
MIPAGDYFEPLIAERVWYQHTQTGDRGYLVRREGKDAIRKDRPSTDDYTFNVGEWKLAADATDKFSAVQIAQVQFEADKKLCWALGMPELAKRDWVNLTEKARLKWMKDGPAAPERAKMYAAVGESMRSK